MQWDVANLIWSDLTLSDLICSNLICSVLIWSVLFQSDLIWSDLICSNLTWNHSHLGVQDTVLLNSKESRVFKVNIVYAALRLLMISEVSGLYAPIEDTEISSSLRGTRTDFIQFKFISIWFNFIMNIQNSFQVLRQRVLSNIIEFYSIQFNPK